MSNKQREHWGSRFGMLMAAAGSAIGLGTLWKFPYVTGENGGGAFVLAYIICIAIIGIPVFIAELLVGRAAQKGAVMSFSALDYPHTPWKIAGWFGVLSSFFIMSYYSIIAGWGLNYVLMSLNSAFSGRTTEEISSIFTILSQSPDITLFWHFIFTAMTVGIVYPGIRDGIEYWSKWITSLLFVLVLILFCYNLTLPGFSKACSFIFHPDFSKLKPSSLLEALGLALFTLSLGQGVMLTYGSYMRKQDDIPKTALIVASMIIITAVLCSLVIFPVIFTFDRPPQGGPGLIFTTLPLLFTKLPGSLFISTIFFTLFVFTALTSSIAMIEVIVATCIDLWGWSRKKTALIVGLATFTFGIPSALSSRSSFLFSNWELLFQKSFFKTVDDLVSVWLLPMGALLMCLFVGYQMDRKIARIEFFSETNYKFLFTPWRIFIRYIAPVAIITIMLHESQVINIDTFFK